MNPRVPRSKTKVQKSEVFAAGSRGDVLVATLHDVARLAGVSSKTVSNVVNDYQYVKPGTREKVKLAIDELGYRPNITARNLRTGRTGLIGLLLPELSLSYFAELADDVIAEAEKHGLVVLIEKSGGDRDKELSVLSSPRMQLTDGLIFSPLGMSQEDAHLLALDYPLVLLGERIFGSQVDHVTMRNVDTSPPAPAPATPALIPISTMPARTFLPVFFSLPLSAVCRSPKCSPGPQHRAMTHRSTFSERTGTTTWPTPSTGK